MPSSEKTLYSATAKASGFPVGEVASTDGRLKLQISVPEAVSGIVGPGTNPAELMAAGYASCLNTALHHVAREAGISLPENASVSLTAGIVPRSTGGLEFAFDVKIALPGLPEEQARMLVQKTHRHNPYCNSLRADLPRKLEISVKA